MEPEQNKQIMTEELDCVETLEMEPLSPALIKILKVEALLMLIVLQALLWGAYFIFKGDLSLWIFIAGAVGLVLLSIARFSWAKHAYTKRGYALRTYDFNYEKGLFFHKIQTIPLAKVQEVHIQQSLLAKIFKIWSLKICNARQSDTSDGLVVPGFSREKAERLKAHILKQVTKYENRNHENTEPESNGEEL